MKLGAAGKTLIQSFEKLALVAYKDQGGVWTIGWGHTGPEAFEGATCSPAQADAWFDTDIRRAVNATNHSLDVALNQNQFDALVAFTYNVGVGAEAHSALLRLVNGHHFDAAALEFGKWNHVAGQVSAGLTRRREAERELFVAPLPGAPASGI